MPTQWIVDRPEPPKAPPLPPDPEPAVVSRGVVQNLAVQLRENIRAKTTAQSGERGALRKAFADIDTDKSGLIDEKEFCLALERFGLHTQQHGLQGGAGGLSKEVVTALFDSFDADNSGYLDYQEYAPTRQTWDPARYSHAFPCGLLLIPHAYVASRADLKRRSYSRSARIRLRKTRSSHAFVRW